MIWRGIRPEVRRLIFRTTASADMRSIASYTRKKWGDDQAATYVAILRDGIKSLCEFPLRFPEFEPRPSLRQMNSGRHAVFYLILNDRIEIIRVMHVASDFERWLWIGRSVTGIPMAMNWMHYHRNPCIWRWRLGRMTSATSLENSVYFQSNFEILWLRLGIECTVTNFLFLS